MVLIAYATSKGTGATAWIATAHSLLADMKQIDQTTKVIRHLAPLDE